MMLKNERLLKETKTLTEQLNKEWNENQRLTAQVQKFKSGIEVYFE